MQYEKAIRGFDSGPAASSECRQRYIPQAVDSMGYAIDENDRLVSLLFERLQPILGPALPQPNNKAEAGFIAAPGLAVNINDKAERLRSINVVLQDVLDRIEL